MATFKVTTVADTVANDGQTSLREALAAATHAGDLIIFDAALNDHSIVLTGGPLDIATGANLVIDGDIDDDGLADITIDGNNSTSLLLVHTGATADITGLRFVHGYSAGRSEDGGYGHYGAFGQGGHAGYDALYGAGGYDPEPGGDGFLGHSGGAGYGGDGAAVTNYGTLTLRSVEFQDNISHGAPGGYGGAGGDGGTGGDGGDGEVGYLAGYGGYGGAGGNGGYGGDGGDGGNAAGAVINFGTLTLADTALAGNYGYGGYGGAGGYGGNGGKGGDGGDGGDGQYPGGGGRGGNGGNGGDGGDGGDGGYGVGGILNFGTLVSAGKVAANNNAGGGGAAGYYAVGGGYGYYGDGGAVGIGTYAASPGPPGTPGDFGGNGVSGADAAEADLFLNADGGTGSLSGAATTAFIALAGASKSEAAGGATTKFTFYVNRLGDLSGASSVTVNFSHGAGVDAADFQGGVLPGSQLVSFAAGQNQKKIEIVVANDGKAEANETFALTLSSPTGMALGTTTSKTATILNDDHAPAITSNGGGAQASVSIAENTKVVTTVAATDADGQALTYAIVAGGDGALFTLNPTTHQLSFTNAPDFDAPGDAGHNNVYDVSVRVSDGSQTDTQLLHVSVTNIAGVAINGTAGKDTVDATNSVGIQPKPTGEEDTIAGQGNKDKLSGLGGNDAIAGGSGNDTIHGGDGNDLISGGKGLDKLYGEAGADSFLFDAKLSQPADKVKDFVSGEDFVLLDDAKFKGLDLGALTEKEFTKHFDYHGGKLSFDGHDFASFAGKPDLSAADFIVV